MEKQSSKVNQKKNQWHTLQLQSGNKIPIIGYGTYELKGDECIKGLEHALKIGYRHIDTASIYKNQVDIAKVLSKCNIQRKQLFITSKIAPTQQGYNQAKQACKIMIQKLGCSYLDLLLIHWPGVSKTKVNDPKNADIRNQTWRALIELKNEGNVKDIGVSNFLKHHLQDLYNKSNILPSVNQIQVHPLLWQTQTIDFCRQKNIRIEAYSPLARGSTELMQNQIMIQLAQKLNKTVPQIALRYLIQENMIVLPKSKNQKRIEENLQLFDFQIQMKDIEKISSLHTLNVRTCWNPEQILF